MTASSESSPVPAAAETPEVVASEAVPSLPESVSENEVVDGDSEVEVVEVEVVDIDAEDEVEAEVELVEVVEVEVVELEVIDAGTDAVVEVDAALVVAEDADIEVPAVAEADVESPVVPDADGADSAPWGRVDADGTVSVREGDQWRVVGQFPDGTPEEALAYFVRKYSDLADKVTLLEQRHRRGGASASDLRSAADRLTADLTDAAAVGDLAALSARVDALRAQLAEASAAEATANREAVDAALAERTTLVERAEALSARDPASVQWKQASADMSALFDAWQEQQQHGPRLPRAAAQALWKRFREARATFERHRREFYAGLDEVHKAARDRKTRLIERAEALSAKGEDGISDYRALLDEWKAAGRAGKKADDALWARFKAAGDALYGARAARDAEETEASKEKIVQREALLVEAKTIAGEKDIAAARARLTSIQRRWDDIGRIFPRERERALDDELRKVENALRAREESDWKRNNPETKARANDMTRQLMDAIAKLEADVSSAKAAGDKAALARAEEALAARKSWLTALGG